MTKGMSHSEAGKMGALASQAITQKLKQERIDKYLENPNRCKHCQKPFDYEHRKLKFCDRSCAAKFNNVQRGLKERHTERFCLNCSKELKTHQYKYCSINCSTEHHNKIYWENVLSILEKTNCFPFNQKDNETDARIVKRYLSEKYGRKCFICGITEWMGKEVPIVVDHIDGNSTNHSVSNFRLVCGNCDMQLDTYKSKNKIGRAWRRKYYK